MYLLIYYFIVHRLNKYLLNKINNTEFEFKRIFYSNKYLLQFWIVYKFKLSLFTIQLWYKFNYITILHQHLTTYYSHSYFVFNFKSSFWIQHLSKSAKIYTNAVKLKKKYFCNSKIKDDFKNMICLSYLGCSS